MIGKIALRRIAGPVRCGHCRRVVGGYVPNGGDGSVLVARRHKDDEDMVERWGGLKRNWCEGSKKPATEIE